MSGIKNLPVRYPTIGRLRLGEKAEGTSKSGKTFTKPERLEVLRFTSDDEVVLKAVASQHGGEVREWVDGEERFELYSETRSVPVLLPPDPIDMAYEAWGSGGLSRRCDGERCLTPSATEATMTESNCLCLAQGLVPHEDKDACKLTLRLRLVLPDVPGLGVWLCTTHSFIAATELPAQVQLLAGMADRGVLIPAEFSMEHRTLKKRHEKFEREFNVPVLRVRASLRELGLGGGSDSPQIAGGSASPPVGAAERQGVGPPSALPAPPLATEAQRDAIRADLLQLAGGEDGLSAWWSANKSWWADNAIPKPTDPALTAEQAEMVRAHLAEVGGEVVVDAVPVDEFSSEPF